jgi:hypothetical protein
MMCGGKESKARLEYYRQQFKQFAPAARFLANDTDLCEIAIVGSTSDTWSIHRVKTYQWDKTFRAIIIVGDRAFQSDW